MTPRPDLDVEALNDRLAREHPIDDYYARSALPIRLIERRRLAIIRELVGGCPGLELCEVGAGGGHVLRGYDVRFIKGEVEKLDLPPASFDRVVCTEVLEHTLDPAAILAALARLLRPDGVAVITIPNDDLIGRLKAVVRRTPVGWLLRHRIEWGGDAYHLHRWTPADFRRLLEDYFRVTDFRGAPLDALPLRACYRCVAR